MEILSAFYIKYNPAHAKWENNTSHTLHAAAEPHNLTVVPLFTMCPPLSSDLIYVPSGKKPPWYQMLYALHV